MGLLYLVLWSDNEGRPIHKDGTGWAYEGSGELYNLAALLPMTAG